MDTPFAKTTLDHSGLGTVIVNADRLVLFWNRWMANHSGIATKDAIGHRLETLFNEPLPARLSATIDAAFEKGQSAVLSHSINPRLLPLFHKGDKQQHARVPHNIQVKALRDANDQLRCVIEITDVNAAFRREQTLREKSRELHALAVSHERQEAYARAVIENVHDALITIDEDDGILDLNHAAHQLFDLDDKTALQQNINRWIPLGALAESTTNKIEIQAKRGDESPFYAEVSVSSFKADNQTQRILVVRDLSDRKQAEENLFREKELAQATLRSIHEAVITTDQAGRVNSSNTAACTLLQKDADALSGQALLNLITLSTVDARRAIREGLKRTLSQGESYEIPDTSPHELRHPDGESIYVSGRISPLKATDGTTVGALIAIRDITLQHRMNEILTHQATHDELTQLINRREFERQLGELLETQHKKQAQHVLLYIDLDQFKLINDTCGHNAGDQLLRQLTGLLTTRLRHTDTLGRLGGDEFAVLLRDCIEEVGYRIAETLRETVSTFRFNWNGRIFAVGASIGLITLDGKINSLAETLAAADAACYIAKENGRNQVVIYQQDGNQETQRKTEMSQASHIRESLEENRFALFCQPIVHIEDGRWGIEILVRMFEEDGQMVPPMGFIPAAERYGLMWLIDRWVVEHVCQSWHATPERFADMHKIAINLSGQSVASEEFLEFVEQTVDQYDLPWNKLCFEITETAAVASIEQAQAFMARLANKGCQFALDDFGSGLSSFTYLKHLAVDYLKIDGAFVRDMLIDDIDAAMVRSISDVGTAMGLETIAEFVEDQQVIAALKKAGVNWAQGYGICKPIPLAEIDHFRAAPFSGSPPLTGQASA